MKQDKQDVVAAHPLFLSKGYGWWAIELSCGHTYAVLHGPTSPLRAHVRWCNMCEADRRERQEAQA